MSFGTNLTVSTTCEDNLMSDDDDVVEISKSQPGIVRRFIGELRSFIMGNSVSNKQDVAAKSTSGTSRIVKRRSRQDLLEVGKICAETNAAHQKNTKESACSSSINNNDKLYAPAMTSMSRIPRPSQTFQQPASRPELWSSGTKRTMLNAQQLNAPRQTIDVPHYQNADFVPLSSAAKQRRLNNDDASCSIPLLTTATKAPAPLHLDISFATKQDQQSLSGAASSSTTAGFIGSWRPASRNSTLPGLGGLPNSSTKRRLSLFESKTISPQVSSGSPHFKVEKMDNSIMVAPSFVDRTYSPLYRGVSSLRQGSPLAPRLVRLDIPLLSTAGQVSVSPVPSTASSKLTNGNISPTNSSNTTVQRLQRAYQQLASASVVLKPGPPNVVLDPTQFFSKVEKVTSRKDEEHQTLPPTPIQSQKLIKAEAADAVTAKAALRFRLPEPAFLVGADKMESSAKPRFYLAPVASVVERSFVASSLWTCPICQMANSTTNITCFSCSASKPLKGFANEIPSTQEDKRGNPIADLLVPATKVVQTTSQQAYAPQPQQTLPTVKSTPQADSIKQQDAAVTSSVVGSWRCCTCMQFNKLDASSCVRCGTSATVTTNTDGKEAPPVQQSSRLKRRVQIDGGWTCACMHVNPKNAIACDLCNSRKPAAQSIVITSTPLSAPVISSAVTVSSTIKPTSTPPEAVIHPAQFNLTTVTMPSASGAPLTIPTPVVVSDQSNGVKNAGVSGWGDKFSAKPGQWTCGTCMVRNDADKMKCAACEGPKPGNGNDTSSVPQKSEILQISLTGGFSFPDPAKSTEMCANVSTAGGKFTLPAPTNSVNSTVSSEVPQVISPFILPPGGFAVSKSSDQVAPFPSTSRFDMVGGFNFKLPSTAQSSTAATDGKQAAASISVVPPTSSGNNLFTQLAGTATSLPSDGKQVAASISVAPLTSSGNSLFTQLAGTATSLPSVLPLSQFGAYGKDKGNADGLSASQPKLSQYQVPVSTPSTTSSIFGFGSTPAVASVFSNIAAPATTSSNTVNSFGTDFNSSTAVSSVASTSAMTFKFGAASTTSSPSATLGSGDLFKGGARPEISTAATPFIFQPMSNSSGQAGSSLTTSFGGFGAFAANKSQSDVVPPFQFAVQPPTNTQTSISGSPMFPVAGVSNPVTASAASFTAPSPFSGGFASFAGASSGNIFGFDGAMTTPTVNGSSSITPGSNGGSTFNSAAFNFSSQPAPAANQTFGTGSFNLSGMPANGGPTGMPLFSSGTSIAPRQKAQAVRKLARPAVRK